MTKFPRVRVERRYDFIATHCLPDAGSKAARAPHEHQYFVWVILDHEINPSLGWAMDFDEVDARMSPIIGELDGLNLNDIINPPTSEMVAIHLLKKCPGWVSGIRVSENERSSSEITRKANGYEL